MQYEFENRDGGRILVDLPMDEAPAFGEECRGPDGRVYRRVYSIPHLCGAHAGSTKWPRFESSALPRNWEFHTGEFSPSGKPRFESRKQIDEALTRENAVSEDLHTKYGEL
jgi:hypothetical protein